jgi:hypothetical protein
VGLSLVVAGLGGSRSEKRAVGLSGKGGWPWLSAGGGGGKKRKKKKFPRRADPNWWFQVLAAEKTKKKIQHPDRQTQAEIRKIGKPKPPPRRDRNPKPPPR